jgi:hypothetical protein
MNKMLKALALVGTTLFAGSTLATELVCDVYPKGNGNSWGNGTSSCDALDFSFGNSTSGKYYLKNISKPISNVIWSGKASCNGGTSCGVTVRAYSSNTAGATVLYQDGTYEIMNTARMSYETGH